MTRFGKFSLLPMFIEMVLKHLDVKFPTDILSTECTFLFSQLNCPNRGTLDAYVGHYCKIKSEFTRQRFWGKKNEKRIREGN